MYEIEKRLGRKPSVALVQDSSAFRDKLLLPQLSALELDVEPMSSALELYRSLVCRRYDLILVDVMLPDEDGLETVAHLKTMLPGLGVVLLGERDFPSGQVRGLRLGVDGYLTKPVDAELMRATLENVLSRVRPSVNHLLDNAIYVDKKRRWSIEDDGWRLVSPNGGRIPLGMAERQVVGLLAKCAGEPVSRDTLIECLTDDVSNFDPHRLEMLIHRLRRRCLKLSGSELTIRTVRGVGYLLLW